VEQSWDGCCVFTSGGLNKGTHTKSHIIMDDVQIDDPMYQVRSRLGTRLGELDREETMKKIESESHRMDDEIVAEILKDCREATKEMRDMIDRDSEDPMQFNPQERFSQPQEPLDEEARERIMKFFQISSLQVAYDGYFAFKSIVMN